MIVRPQLARNTIEPTDAVRPALHHEASETAKRELRSEAIQALHGYTPGGAAALQPVLDQLQWMCRVDGGSSASSGAVSSGREGSIPGANGRSADNVSLPPLSKVVKEHVIRVYRDMGGNKTRAARVLEIDIKTLYNKLKRYGIQ